MATLAVISHRVGLHDLLTHLHLLQDTLRHQGAWGYLVYAALFIIATLCLIPGSLLVIAGGMLFGPLTGSLLSFAAATLASSLSFLIARWLGRDLLQRYVGHTTVFQAIERGIARSGCDFLILTHCGAKIRHYFDSTIVWQKKGEKNNKTYLKHFSIQRINRTLAETLK